MAEFYPLLFGRGLRQLIQVRQFMAFLYFLSH